MKRTATVALRALDVLGSVAEELSPNSSSGAAVSRERRLRAR